VWLRGMARVEEISLHSVLRQWDTSCKGYNTTIHFKRRCWKIFQDIFSKIIAHQCDKGAWQSGKSYQNILYCCTEKLYRWDRTWLRILKGSVKGYSKTRTTNNNCTPGVREGASDIGTCRIVALRNFMDVLGHNSQFWKEYWKIFQDTFHKK
jgi:hypothetical protein